MQYADGCFADKPRFIILSSWLQDNADPDQIMHHIQKVMAYAERQHKSGRGFILINEPPVTRVEKAQKLLEPFTRSIWSNEISCRFCATKV